jgi:hypothetical protein
MLLMLHWSSYGAAVNPVLRGAQLAMVRLTRRQHQVLLALAVANTIALGGLAALLLQAPSYPDEPSITSPISPVHLDACRRATSRALLAAGQIALVHTREDGTILIQLQRAASADDLRFAADAATWAAFEAVAARADCQGLSTVQVTVVVASLTQELPLAHCPCQEPSDTVTAGQGGCGGLRAIARIRVADLMMWSLGEIDDAELALRADYRVVY